MSNVLPICKICNAWMLDHPVTKGYKKCIGCGYCEDYEGYNKLNLRLITKCSCSTNEQCSNCEDEK